MGPNINLSKESVKGRDLATLIELLSKTYRLSIDDLTSLSGIESPVLTDLLEGKVIQFRKSHIEKMLNSLLGRGIVRSEQDADLWSCAFRIASFVHYDCRKFSERLYNDMQPMEDSIERIKTFQAEKLDSCSYLFETPYANFPKTIPLEYFIGPLYQSNGVAFYKLITNKFLTAASTKINNILSAILVYRISNKFSQEQHLFMFLIIGSEFEKVLGKVKEIDEPIASIHFVDPGSISSSDRSNSTYSFTNLVWEVFSAHNGNAQEKLFKYLNLFINVPMTSSQEKEFGSMLKAPIPTIEFDYL